MGERSLLKQFTIIGGGAVLNMLIGFITTPLITRLVDPGQYGQATMFNTYANIALMVVSLGMDQAFMRYFFQHDEVMYKRKILWACLFLPIGLFGVLGAPIVLTYLKLYGRTEKNIVLVFTFVIYVFILLFNRFSMLLLRLTKKAKTYSVLNVLYKILYVVFALTLIGLIDNYLYYLIIVANVVAYLIVTVWSIICEKDIWNPLGNKAKLEFSYKALIQYGIPMMVANGIFMIFQAIDRLSLSYYCSYHDVGVYSSAMSLMSIISILRSTFNTIWAPTSVEHYEKNPNDKSFFQKGNQYITVIMFFFGLSLMLVKDLIILLLGSQYREAAMILPFLLFQPIMYTVSETTVIGIYFKHKSYASLIISGVACVVNIIGNCMLIPLVGAKGAAISTGVSYIVFFALRTFFSNKYYYVEYKLKKYYFLTILALLYACYNTFIHFGLGSIVIYLIIIAIMLIMYKQIVLELVQQGWNRLKTLKNNVQYMLKNTKE